MRWADFEAEAPELASLGRDCIERFGFLFIATIRSDGGPRINPVEAHFVEGDLALCLIPQSLKALDLIRDPRAFLHTVVTDAQLGTPGEFKLRVRALEARDATLRERIADVFERESDWRPLDDWPIFTLDLEGAAFHRYDEEQNVHRLVRWTPRRGVERSTRTYL